MSIKRLREEDVSEIMKVLKLFFTRESSKEQIQKFLSDEKNYILVYKHDEKVLGFAYGYELQRFDGRKNMVYLHQIEVLPEFRQQGIGKQLIEKFMKICKNNDCEKMFLITNKSLKPAVRLYESTNGKADNDDDIVFAYEI